MKHKASYGMHYIICDICGRKLRRKDAHISGKSVLSSQNYLVCKDDLDVLNQQDLVRGKSDRIALPASEVRSERVDTFLQTDVTARDL